jgi:hypothetical protein
MDVSWESCLLKLGYFSRHKSTETCTVLLCKQLNLLLWCLLIVTFHVIFISIDYILNYIWRYIILNFDCRLPDDPNESVSDLMRLYWILRLCLQFSRRTNNSAYEYEMESYDCPQIGASYFHFNSTDDREMKFKTYFKGWKDQCSLRPFTYNSVQAFRVTLQENVLSCKRPCKFISSANFIICACIWANISILNYS